MTAIGDLFTSRIGFGGAPLGNMFRNVPEEEARATLDAAWDCGIRYFDNAPLYGAGLAEIRMGDALSRHPREDYLISTKVGRIIHEEAGSSDPRRPAQTGEPFEHGRPNRVINDYSENGTLRSIEDSLKRLKTDHVEIVWVHDVAQDTYGDEWLGVFESARSGAFKALDRLRDEGVIKAWGLGVNRVEPIELLLELDVPRPDGFLLAGRYTLLDHTRALQRVMPMVLDRGLGIVIGGAYNSGVLAGGPNFQYVSASPQIVSRVSAIKKIAERHGVSMKAASLQFTLAHPAVIAVIPGASRPERIAEDSAAVNEKVPAGFWHELRNANLIDTDAPLQK